MRVVVEDYLGKGASEIDLRKATLNAAVESRIRSARLYDKDATAYLYLNVLVVGGAVSIDLSYAKRVFDIASEEFRTARTWHIGVAGTLGKDATYIVGGVAELMDEFLLEYLRINEKHC